MPVTMPGGQSGAESAAIPEHKARQFIPPVQPERLFTGMRAKKDPAS